MVVPQEIADVLGRDLAVGGARRWRCRWWGRWVAPTTAGSPPPSSAPGSRWWTPRPSSWSPADRRWGPTRRRDPPPRRRSGRRAAGRQLRRPPRALGRRSGPGSSAGRAGWPSGPRPLPAGRPRPVGRPQPAGRRSRRRGDGRCGRRDRLRGRGHGERLGPAAGRVHPRAGRCGRAAPWWCRRRGRQRASPARRGPRTSSGRVGGIGGEHPLQRLGHGGGPQRRPDVPAGHAVQHRQRVVLHAERRLALEAGVERGPEREDVAGLGHLPALGDLGGQERRRPGDLAGLGRASRRRWRARCRSR